MSAAKPERDFGSSRKTSEVFYKIPDLSFELPLWQNGAALVGGVDEAGRGAWAGPVAAAAVVFPPDGSLVSRLPGVRDSKQMTPLARERWAIEIREVAVGWGVGLASNEEIDTYGILPATRLAAARALAELATPPDHLLIDYLLLPAVSIPQTPIVKGDARSLTIAAASVLAKTARDGLLVELERRFPGYGFDHHKGYGTAEHQRALAQLGPSPAHRLTFAPVRAWVEAHSTELTRPGLES